MPQIENAQLWVGGAVGAHQNPGHSSRQNGGEVIHGRRQRRVGQGTKKGPRTSKRQGNTLPAVLWRAHGAGRPPSPPQDPPLRTAPAPPRENIAQQRVRPARYAAATAALHSNSLEGLHAAPPLRDAGRARARGAGLTGVVVRSKCGRRACAHVDAGVFPSAKRCVGSRLERAASRALAPRRARCGHLAHPGLTYVENMHHAWPWAQGHRPPAPSARQRRRGGRPGTPLVLLHLLSPGSARTPSAWRAQGAP